MRLPVALQCVAAQTFHPAETRKLWCRRLPSTVTCDSYDQGPLCDECGHSSMLLFSLMVQVTSVESFVAVFPFTRFWIAR